MAKSKFGLFYSANTEAAQVIEGDYLVHNGTGFVSVYADAGAGDRNKDTQVGVFNLLSPGTVVKKVG